MGKIAEALLNMLFQCVCAVIHVVNKLLDQLLYMYDIMNLAFMHLILLSHRGKLYTCMMLGKALINPVIHDLCLLNMPMIT